MPIQTSTLQLQVGDKPVNAYLAVPEGGGPGVLVLHAWWGLNPFFKRVCERLAAQGFVALAPDMFNGSIATTIEAAQKQASDAFGNSARIEEIVAAAGEYLRAYPANTAEKLGVLGFSFGAAWTLVAATRAPALFSAAAVFYGTAGPMDFTPMQASFMGHYSDVDHEEPLDGIRATEKAMQQAGVDATFHIYPGLPHWFAEDDRPEYNPAAAELAWTRTLEFLKQHA